MSQSQEQLQNDYRISHEICYLFISVIFMFLICYFFYYEGKLHIPDAAWEWIFSISMLISFIVQQSLDFYFDENEMYKSINKKFFCKMCIKFFPFIQGIFAFASIYFSLQENSFKEHMLFMSLYFGYFFALDLLVLFNSTPKEDKINLANYFKGLCLKTFLGTDLSALLGILIIWGVLQGVYGNIQMSAYISEPNIYDKHKYQLIHIIMSGALGLHMVITSFAYLIERTCVHERIKQRLGI